MSTATLTLTDFLRARFDEDEVDINEGHTLRCSCTRPCYAPGYGPPDFALCDCKQRRLLAEIEAKRRIVDRYSQNTDPRNLGWWSKEAEKWLAPVLRLLALSYSHHPDYRDEWRP